MKLIWKGDEVARAVKQAAVSGLTDAAEHVLEEANRTVPHDEGTLHDSGTTSFDVASLKAVVSYDTPYAKAQHEDVTMSHPGGGRAKWLESTIKERQSAVRDYIAKQLKSALGG